MTFEKLRGIILPLIALVVVLAGGYGVWNLATGGVEGVINGTKISFGTSNATGERPVLPEEHERAVDGLVDTIKKMLGDKQDCFLRYPGGPALGKKGTGLFFSKADEKTSLIVKGGVGGEQIIKTVDIKMMKPCVIAGEGDYADKFFEKFIDKDDVNERYFNPVDNIRIRYDVGEGWGMTCTNGNRLEHSDGPNKYCNNFNDGQLLFTPDGEHICFFTNNFAPFINADEHGIDEDWFGGDSDSLVNKFKEGKLTKCE